ncbi:hypothetical protein [Streptomyces sp. NPDC059781]|uniref:hypothetical protein n=1 Tax=Streptomyces sp. NPDC059781 TaxID=3346943 RepID=UPI00366378B9
MRDSPVEADMEQDTSRPSDLPQPLRAVTSGLRHLPGAEQVGRVAGGALDAIGAVSPRGRRMAVYAGAGVLGVAGVVEWPVALTGAAVAWLTQPRPAQRPDGGDGKGPARRLAGEPGAEPPADADERHETPAGSGTSAGRPPTGPGDRLTPSRDRTGRTGHPVRVEPAKVGDTATASALKQVADATRHPDPGPDRAEHPVGDEPAEAGDTAERVAGAVRHRGAYPDPGPGRGGAPGQPRDARHTG